MNLNDNIRFAESVIMSKDAERFNLIYAFPTENVSDCLCSYDFKNKKCLTVLGSSAQMLYMYLNDAKNIDTFDTNPLTIYYFYFIKAFIKSGLSYQVFIDFITKRNFDDREKVYQYINNYLFGEASLFWNTIVEKYGLSAIVSNNLSTKTLFHLPECPNHSIPFYSGYLNDESLKELRKKIDFLEPRFFKLDIKDLISLDCFYDFVYLSNIMQYSCDIFSLDYENEALGYYRDLVINLGNKLNENGEIYAAYIYGNNKMLDNIYSVFEEESNFCFETFPSFDSWNMSGQDLKLIYKKN